MRYCFKCKKPISTDFLKEFNSSEKTKVEISTSESYAHGYCKKCYKNNKED